MSLQMITSGMLKKYGTAVQGINSGSVSGEPYNAIVQPLRYTNKQYIGEKQTELGPEDIRRYLYIGPAEHDITLLDKHNDRILFDGKKCTIEKCERVYVSGKVVYIWAVLKETTED